VHTVELAVTIRVEIRFHPEIMPDPSLLIGKRVYNLSLTILERR
jgi:hypothetical protein